MKFRSYAYLVPLATFQDSLRLLSLRAAPAPAQDDPMLQPTFVEASPRQMWSYGPMALSLSFGG